LRRHGRIREGNRLQPHDHVVWMGRGSDDLYALATAALAQGARRNEKLIFIAEDPDPGRLQGVGDLDALLTGGQLELAPVDAVYDGSSAFNQTTQLATFEEVLAEALAHGYTGIRVIADNTSLATGDDARFHRWLRWEQVADRFQATSNVTGICYFDSRALSSDRRADLAALHPVRSVTTPPTPFSFVVDGDAISVTGTLDFWSEVSSSACSRPFPTKARWCSISPTRTSSITARCWRSTRRPARPGPCASTAPVPSSESCPRCSRCPTPTFASSSPRSCVPLLLVRLPGRTRV
jgi:MEDS: MEthanogen/methylotroph, DcmR Sensory domain